MEKLDVKTVNKKQLGKALVYTGKFTVNHNLNYKTTKLIRNKVADFIEKLRNTRKDLQIIVASLDDSDYDLADKKLRYNHIIVGRGLFNCGYHLLHPDKDSDDTVGYDYTQDTSDPKVIPIVYQTDTTIVGKKDYVSISKAIKAGKDYNDVMEKISDKAIAQIDKSVPDYNPDYDKNAEAMETAQLDDVDTELHASCIFANKYGKSKQDKNKLFLQGLIISD